MPHKRTNPKWQRTNLASMTDVYKELDVEIDRNGDDLFKPITGALNAWRFSHVKDIPKENDYDAFRKQHVFTDPHIRALNTARWKDVQKEYLGVKYDDYKLWTEDIWDCWVKHKLKSIKRKNLNRRKKVKTGSIDSSAPPTKATTPSDDERTYDDYAESTNEQAERSDVPHQIDDEITVASVSPTVGFISDSSTPLFSSAITHPDTLILPSSPMEMDPQIPPQFLSRTRQSDSVSSRSSKRRKRNVERRRFEESLMKTISQWLEDGLLDPVKLRALATNHAIDPPSRTRSESLRSGHSAQEESDANGDSESMKDVVQTVSPRGSAVDTNHPDDAFKPPTPCSESPRGVQSQSKPPTSGSVLAPPRSASPVQSQSHPSPGLDPSSTFKSSTPLEKELANRSAKLKHRQTPVQTPRPSNKHGGNKDDDESSYHPSHSEDEEQTVHDLSDSDDSSNAVTGKLSKPSIQAPSSSQMGPQQSSSSGWRMMIHTVDSDSELDETVGSTKVNKSRLYIRAIPPDDLEELDNPLNTGNKTLAEATPELSEDESNSEMDTEMGEKDPEEEKRKFRRRLRAATLQGKEMEQMVLKEKWERGYEPELKAGFGLHPWQKLGVTFLHHCRKEFGFALMADEMGIGKTVQTLSYIWGRNRAWEKGDKGDKEYSRYTNLVVVPCALEVNWINETAKFFDPKELRAKKWTELAWNEDHSIRTVWIIRDTRITNTLVECVNNTSVGVLSLFADEAQTAFRSLESNRAKHFLKISKFADFVVLISGTPFPLGPKEDSYEILVNLAGGGPDKPIAKWSQKQRAWLNNLFFKRGGWNVLSFRKLITPFYLCRHSKSQWNGKPIIPEYIVRPRPYILLPKPVSADADFIKEFNSIKPATNKRDGLVDLSALRLRSDDIKLTAWTPLWRDIKESTVHMKAEQKKAVMESKIKNELETLEPTGRMNRLVSIVKRVHFVEKEKFIIVADRIFLLLLAIYVRGPLKHANEQLCETGVGIKIGVLAGQKLFLHTTAQRDRVPERLNTGEIDGVIMTDRVGACGHNLVGANHMIFMGSLYSQAYEDQAIARMCRQGQSRIPHVYIIGNPNFIGDSIPMNIKRSRGEGDELLRRRLTAGEFSAYENIEELLIDVVKELTDAGNSKADPIPID